MKANEIFSLKRFGKYFGSDIKTCWANFALNIGQNAVGIVYYKK